MRRLNVEAVCAAVTDRVGKPITLLCAVMLSLAWVCFGTAARIDPYPFQFLSTVCNLLGFWLLFVLAVGQRKDDLHDRFDMLHSHLEDVHERLTQE